MSYQKILNLYKELGETPLARIERFKWENPEYQALPMTYAGRLDPMAEGLLLVLVGEECKKKNEYLGLSKEYTGEVLLGVSTDTGDALGLLECQVESSKMFSLSEVEAVAQRLVRKQVQEYPSYSSKTVAGKPLWKLAREGEVVEKPTREVEVFSFELNDLRELDKVIIFEKIKIDIEKVEGDFRQEKIIKSWEEALEKSRDAQKLQVVSFECEVSSGTYVRVLAEKLGSGLSVGSLLYSLKRTRVGDYKIADSIK
jgi:tRNA pseudouridine55 synthase